MSLCKQCDIPDDWKVRATYRTRSYVYEPQPPFRRLNCFPRIVSIVRHLQPTAKTTTRKQSKICEETGFITLSTLCVSFICFLLIGYIMYEVRQNSMQSWRYEQTERADLLAQDAIELAKQELTQNTAWRGLSNWIPRTNGSCRYKIKTNADLPISPSVQTQYPNGLFIEATGKTSDGSTRVIDVWYIPSLQKTVAFEYV